jgi:hypothetical protein
MPLFFSLPAATGFLCWDLAFAAVEFSILLFSTAEFSLFMPAILLPGGRISNFLFLYRRIFSVCGSASLFRR